MNSILLGTVNSEILTRVLFSRFSSQICLLTLFAKINIAQKFQNVQYNYTIMLKMFHWRLRLPTNYDKSAVKIQCSKLQNLTR